MSATRFIALTGVAVGLVIFAIGAGEARAQGQASKRTGAFPQGSIASRPDPTPCRPARGRIGLARTVEIDTSGGPRFGQQYRDNDFLRDKEVVLTFDDGPLRHNSRMVLDALAAHCTKATFFMVGRMALADPGVVREVASQGHTIALHTWSHRNLRAIGKERAIAEFEFGLSMVQRALGRPVTPFFRFPYLADSKAMLEHFSQRNFAVFSIDADSLDFRTRNPNRMRDKIMSTLRQRGKGILLFHDIQTSTARGIRGVLDELATHGFKVVHIIAKQPATTVASYDDRANTEFVKRDKLLAAFPMLERSVVWPMPASDGPIERLVPGLAAASRNPPDSASTPHRPSAANFTPGANPQGNADGLQPATAQPGSAAQPAPEARPSIPRPTFNPDEGWQTRVFNP